MVPLTCEIVALRYLNKGDDQSRVLWAENMLLAGFDCPHLSVLCGELPPFNKFEIDAMFDKVRKELKLPDIQSLADAIETYTTARILHFLKGRTDSAATLFELAEFYNEYDQFDSIQDFYLLHYAAVVLEQGEQQWYWPDANRENIEETILMRCKQWLADHPLDRWQGFEWQ